MAETALPINIQAVQLLTQVAAVVVVVEIPQEILYKPAELVELVAVEMALLMLLVKPLAQLIAVVAAVVVHILMALLLLVLMVDQVL
jgi:hypothetical protein